MALSALNRYLWSTPWDILLRRPAVSSENPAVPSAPTAIRRTDLRKSVAARWSCLRSEPCVDTLFTMFRLSETFFSTMDWHRSSASSSPDSSSISRTWSALSGES